MSLQDFHVSVLESCCCLCWVQSGVVIASEVSLTFLTPGASRHIRQVVLNVLNIPSLP